MLELKNISKSYGQGTLKNNVLREINFKVVEGEFVSIMGPSGDIGFVCQQFHLIDEYTVQENILLSFLYSDQQPDIEYIDSLLQDLGLIDKMNEYPSHLSGGQKQRVALIRALAHKPRFLIADEPTGALDEKNRNEILQILQNLNHSGTTIIVVTHDEFVASHCRTRYRMKNGYLTSEGEGLHEV